MRVYLIRHGEVAPPRPGQFYGGSEVPLTSRGEHQAHAAAALVRANWEGPLDLLWSSPLSRARYGAEQVHLYFPEAEIQIQEKLREIDRGRWLGWTPEEVERKFPGDLKAHTADPENWREHGGESLGDIRKRVLEAFRNLLTQSQVQTAVIVSHMWPTTCILAEAFGYGYDRWEELCVPTGSVSLLECNGKNWQVQWYGKSENS